MISINIWKTAVRLTPSFVFPIFRDDRQMNDRNLLDRKNPDEPTTGFQRVKKLFIRNDYDEYPIELRTIGQSAMVGGFFGVCFGGFIKSKEAYIYFIENNQATIFSSTMEAKKKLQDYVTVAFAKGAMHWGWRLGLFSGIFSLIATIVAVYNDEMGLIDYIMAGAITGGLFKAHLGLAGALVGAGLGATLGTIGGLAIIGLLKVTGISMEDIRKAFLRLKEARESQYNQALEKSAEIKNDDLTRHHDSLVQEKGEQRIENLVV